MQHELSPAVGRALNELRTIQYLEETVGPAGLRRLADALPDDAQREVVQNIRRRAASASFELENILEEWNHHLSGKPRRPTPHPVGGLDTAEILESFIEVKRSSAELLRRSAKEAPTERLRERLLDLAAEEENAAAKLEGLLAHTPDSG